MSHIHKAFDQKLAEIERLRASLREATAKIKLLEKQVKQMSEPVLGDTNRGLMMTTVATARVYNESEYAKEGKNGRIYQGVLGWRWYPFYGADLVEGSDPEGYKTRKEAYQAGSKLLNLAQKPNSN